MNDLNLQTCVELLEELKASQWRIEIIGDEWYDGDLWKVVIKDPFHKIVVQVSTVWPDTLENALIKAFKELRTQENGYSILYRYFKNKEIANEKLTNY